MLPKAGDCNEYLVILPLLVCSLQALEHGCMVYRKNPFVDMVMDMHCCVVSNRETRMNIV